MMDTEIKDLQKLAGIDVELANTEKKKQYLIDQENIRWDNLSRTAKFYEGVVVPAATTVFLGWLLVGFVVNERTNGKIWIGPPIKK